MGHDQLFKDLLKAFFYDFLTLFLPAVAAGIDPGLITFLDPQTFTDLPQGHLRLADLVADLHASGGQFEMVLVHTEVQGELEVAFGYRMWEYNALLRLRHRKPAISVALLPFLDAGEVRLVAYTETLFGQEYHYLDYWQVGLKGLSADDYLVATPILAPILASLMRSEDLGRVELKVTIAERLQFSGLDDARLFLAVNFMETYLELDELEQIAYRARLQTEGTGTMEATKLTWADKILLQGIERGREEGIGRGREEGIEQGREEGELMAKRAVAIRQARSRFGELPVDLEARFARADSASLDVALDQLLLSKSAAALLAALPLEA